MTTRKTLAKWLFGIVAALGIPTAAEADVPGFLAGPPGCNTVFTSNDTPYWMWVTIYDAGQVSRLDWGWVKPFTNRDWKSGNYTCYGIYHVRAEVKSWQGAEPRDTGNIFDTRMEIKGQQHIAVLRTPYYDVIVPGENRSYKQFPGKTFWLDSKTMAQNGRSEGTLQAPAIALTNSTGAPMQAWWDGGRVCLAPAAAQTLVFPKPGTYPLKVAPVPNCGVTAQTALMERPAPVDYGTRNWAFYGRFSLVDNKTGTGTKLTFLNRTPQTYQFVVSGAEAKSPCLPPNAQSGVDLVATKHYIKAVARGTCADTTGAQAKAEWLEAIKDRERVFAFEYRLDPS